MYVDSFCVLSIGLVYTSKDGLLVPQQHVEVFLTRSAFGCRPGMHHKVNQLLRCCVLTRNHSASPLFSVPSVFLSFPSAVDSYRTSHPECFENFYGWTIQRKLSGETIAMSV